MRSALLALLLGGCLIVRTSEEAQIEPPCPDSGPQLLAFSRGPFVITDETIHFIGANETLSRIAVGGGRVSELTTGAVRASRIVADATDLYWASDYAIIRKPLAGGAARAIADGVSNVTELFVDDASVVWASSDGLDRWTKADNKVTRLDSASLILGVGSYDGVYYYSDTQAGVVRRTPPAQQLATSIHPASLVVDEAGVYFFEATDASDGYAGRLRLVPRGGGDVVTTADGLTAVMDLTADDNYLYFSVAGGNSYRIKQVSRFGGSVRTLACGDISRPPVLVAQHGSFVYWGDGAELSRAAKMVDRPN
jgi:hypothetical protein